MISIQQFTNEFYYRHDFQYDDIITLKNHFKNIEFNDIPEAWVYELDRVLRMVNSKKIKKIYQVLGFLIVEHSISSATDLNKLKTMERNISKLDDDLYRELDVGIILN